MSRKGFGLVVAMICVVPALVGCAKESEPSLSGIWIMYVGDKGSYVYEVFREDGTWVSGLWAPASSKLTGAELQIKGTYSLDGNVLTTSAGTAYATRYHLDGSVEQLEGVPRPERKYTISWDSDDQITREHIEFETETLSRVDKFPTELRMKIDD